MIKIYTKKPQMAKYLRNLQKLQLKYFGKVTIWIRTLEKNEDRDVAIDVTLMFKYKNYSFDFYQFWEVERNDAVFAKICTTIENNIN